MSVEEKNVVWAPILLAAVQEYIDQKLKELKEVEVDYLDDAEEDEGAVKKEKGNPGYYFERSELEHYLINKFPEATHGSIVGVLNKYLTGENNIERIRRGYYLALDKGIITGKKFLLEIIADIESRILGRNLVANLTQTDLEVLTGITLALRELKDAVDKIEKIEQN